MSSHTIQEPLRLALLGAGTFARDAYLPSLARHPDQFQITAIYSRTRVKAEALAQQIPNPVVCSDSLDAVLALPDVEAVAVLLPISLLPDAIGAALAAQKHILSEKPIAPDVAAGQSLLAQQTHHPGLVWMVGENWRYEEAFVRAAEIVRRGLIGDPLTCSWAIYIPITDRNKYYHTSWRRNSSFPGGFPLDTGVHHVAVMRMLLGEVAQVTAVARQASPDLPPIDTLAATLQFDNGTLGAYVANYMVGTPWPSRFHVVGTRGCLAVQRKSIELTVDGETEQIECSGFDGVEKELLAFARAIRVGEPHLNPPEEALQDLAVMEAMLRAAEQGAPVVPERVV